MNAKKWLALVLCMALALGTLAGCSGTTETDAAEEPEPEESVEITETEEDEIDYEAQYNAAVEKIKNARSKYDADTVVCTIEGQKITWGMLYYFIAADLNEMLYYTGDLPKDFNAPLTGDSTMGQYFSKSALSQAVYFAVANAVPAREGIPYADEAEAEIQEYWAGLLEQYGDEETLLAAMAEAGLDRELLTFFLRSNKGMEMVQKALYDADALSDEAIMTWAEGKGYVRTKHVLYSFYNEDGSSMDDEGKAAQKERADQAWAELSALTGDSAALEARFDEIMAADSGDAGGLSNFPQGYTFTSGTMVTEYEDAAFALGDYELSEVVETSYGYHILLRLPLLADGTTMDQDSSTGAYMTLRQSAANDMFNTALTGWINNAEIVWASPEFEQLDFNDLFDIVPPAEPEG